MLLLTFVVAPGGARLHSLLSPGAALMAKFLPVMFGNSKSVVRASSLVLLHIPFSPIAGGSLVNC